MLMIAFLVLSISVISPSVRIKRTKYCGVVVGDDGRKETRTRGRKKKNGEEQTTLVEEEEEKEKEKEKEKEAKRKKKKNKKKEAYLATVHPA